ncbi:immunity 49 family protein [Streptomyces sp. NPDC017964]|uniref:immunity 49 family protein n=1 Tax=Streptomyces sp. NPDC017964 TaxID=3365022 RepID=UPI003791C4CD
MSRRHKVFIALAGAIAHPAIPAMSYDPGQDAPEESITTGEWINALCLAVLRDKAKWHGEAFHFARNKFAAQAKGTPAGELATGLMAAVLDDTGDDEEYPPSAQAKLAAIDAALDCIRTRAAETGEPLLERPDSAALHALRALVAEDQEAFDAALADLLVRHAALHGPGDSPSTLLPLVPIALAALAYRTLRWAPAVRTDYLPHTLIRGFETRGPRVAGFGRNRRPDAVAALAAGPLTVERPACERDGIPRIEAICEKQLREAFTPVDGNPLTVWRLSSAMRNQEILFKWPAGNGGNVTDVQLATLRLASRMGAALFHFHFALAEPGTEAEVPAPDRQPEALAILAQGSASFRIGLEAPIPRRHRERLRDPTYRLDQRHGPLHPTGDRQALLGRAHQRMQLLLHTRRVVA